LFLILIFYEIPKFGKFRFRKFRDFGRSEFHIPIFHSLPNIPKFKIHSGTSLFWTLLKKTRSGNTINPELQPRELYFSTSLQRELYFRICGNHHWSSPPLRNGAKIVQNGAIWGSKLGKKRWYLAKKSFSFIWKNHEFYKMRYFWLPFTSFNGAKCSKRGICH
jgi:hypothetical protein